MYGQRFQSNQARNESYHSHSNLTPEQEAYGRLWAKLQQLQHAKRSIPFFALGFKATPESTGHYYEGPTDSTQRGQYRRFSAEPLHRKQRFRRMSTVTMCSMSAMPHAWFSGQSEHALYSRLNAMEQAFYVDAGGVLCAGGNFEGRGPFQRNFAIRPSQDCQVFISKSFDPNTVGGLLGEAVPEMSAANLTAPLAGDYTAVHNDLYLDLIIDSVVIYRFDKSAVHDMELTADRTVKEGDVLCKLINKVQYNQVKWKRGRIPCITRTGGDVFPASRRVFSFRLFNRELQEILDAMRADPGTQTALSQIDWLPRPYLMFDVEKVLNPREIPDFKIEPAFRRDLLTAVGPYGDFCIESPYTGKVLRLHDPGPSSMYSELLIMTPRGRQEKIVLPRCVVMRELGEEITAGQPVADWVPRTRYSSYADLARATGSDLFGALSWLEDAFWASSLVYSGMFGWECERNCVLVPKDYVESVLWQMADGEPWLDFQNAMPYLDFVPSPCNGVVDEVISEPDRTLIWIELPDKTMKEVFVPRGTYVRVVAGDRVQAGSPLADGTDGTIVGPAIPHAQWDAWTFNNQGISYNLMPCIGKEESRGRSRSQSNQEVRS